MAAQKQLPAFGKIELADLELNGCPFDNTAAAYVLIDRGNISFAAAGNETIPLTAMYERRVRIKIVKEEGRQYGTVVIPFYSYNNEEKMVDVKAYTYNRLPGNLSKKTMVNRKAIYTKKINRHYSETIILFPEVQAGSVIEYRYRLQSRSGAAIKDWYFQSELPTRYSEFQVSMPVTFKYSIHPLTVDSLEIQEATETGGALVPIGSTANKVLRKNFIMRNLPAIKEEPFMGPAKNYLQRLTIRLAEVEYGNGNIVYVNSEWEDVVNELKQDIDFGRQINKRLPDAATLLRQAATITDLQERMCFLFAYVKCHLQWNGQESVFAYSGVQKAFQNNNGSSAQINLLLINLLQAAGIPVSPVLFSTRNNGLVNTTLPFVKQFNTVMALVEDGDSQYILDATDSNAVVNMIPLKILNTRGFVVAADSGRWITANDTLHQYKISTAVQGTIDSSGLMTGEIFTSFSGYARTIVWQNQAKNKVPASTEIIGDLGNRLRLTNSPMRNTGNSLHPLEQQARFNMTLNRAGQHLYFNTGLFSPITGNPFTAGERSTDIDFGYEQEYTLHGNFLLPAWCTFESVPQPLQLMMPDSSIVFRRFVTTENNLLNIRFRLEFKRNLVTPAEYEGFAAFYKILLSTLNEPIILTLKDPE